MTTKSNFNAKTTADEVVDTFADQIKGKTILITGVGPNGLGASIATALATKSPALLILTGRTLSKVEQITAQLAKDAPSIKTRTLKLDVSSFKDIERAAAEVTTYAEPGIDILINNAGVMNIPTRQLSTDGFEMQLATNYLGLWLFTNSLVPKLAAARGRVVNVVSNGYLLSPFRFTDYNFDEGKGEKLPPAERPSEELCKAFGVPYALEYSPPIAYGQSKTAGILYTRQLAKMLKAKGVSATCLNPGPIATDLWRQMPEEVVQQIFSSFTMKSKEEGAATPLIAALDPKLSDAGGAYLDDSQVGELQDWAKDSALAERLWKLTEKLTGKTFAF